MKLATSTGDFSGFAPRPSALLELFSRTPFRYVDLDLPHSALGDDWKDETEACRRVAEAHQLTFVQAHAGDFYEGGLFAYEHGRLMLDRLERAILACASLKIPQIVIHAQPHFDIPYDNGAPERMEAFFELNRSLYAQLFPVMEETGVKVLIENSAEGNLPGVFYFMTGAEMAAFLDWVGHPLLGAVWDTGHGNLRPNDPYQDIVALGSHLCGLHIHDNDGCHDEHTAPFMGTADFDAVMSGLRDISYEGAFTFECFNYPMRGGSWPYARRRNEQREARLWQPSLALKLEAETYLYHTGQFMLSQYGIGEE